MVTFAVLEIVQLEFDGFDWDTGNIKKAQKHGLDLDEIEHFFKQEFLVLRDHKHSWAETRMIAVGTSRGGRPMFAAFTLRKREELILVRVVSARYTHKKESEAYEKLKKHVEKND